MAEYRQQVAGCFSWKPSADHYQVHSEFVSDLVAVGNCGGYRWEATVGLVADFLKIKKGAWKVSTLPY